jgi:prolyl-tRNA editing enzyme YbaK/EbsC (Cys-tRNA(Pro) deacylase)
MKKHPISQRPFLHCAMILSVFHDRGPLLNLEGELLLTAPPSSSSAISAMENDRVRLGVERAKVLARALKIHPGVIVFPVGSFLPKLLHNLALLADSNSLRLKSIVGILARYHLFIGVIEMPKKPSSSVKKVQDALISHGLTCQVLELPSTTRTAQEAAQTIGCQVGQIVKSIVFMGKRTGKPILVATSGSNRVNEKKLSKLVSEPIKRPNADFVREKTGFAIGGVPPVAHAQRLETFIDEDLLQYQTLWAAAGTPNAVFKLTPSDLKIITNGKIISIT